MNPNFFNAWNDSKISDDESLTIHLSREDTICTIAEELILEYANSVHTPYRSEYTFDKITSPYQPPTSRLQSEQENFQSVVGSLNWLACGTRIDIATITNMLAHHLHSATQSHVVAERYVSKYLQGRKYLGITFKNDKIKWYLCLPQLPPFPRNKLCALTDCQMRSLRSIVARPVWPTQTHRSLQVTISVGGILYGQIYPLHWYIKNARSITVRKALTESDIYATWRICVKNPCIAFSTFLEEIYFEREEFFCRHRIDIYNKRPSKAATRTHSIENKGDKARMNERETPSARALRTYFARVDHISGKVNLFPIYSPKER